MILFMHTMQNSRDIIRYAVKSSNNPIYFSGLILLNIVLELISTYIKKRTVDITDSFDQEESKAS